VTRVTGSIVALRSVSWATNVIRITADQGHPPENGFRRIEPLPKFDEVVAMIVASDLDAGMAIRIDRQIYKVVEVESKAGTAKTSGVIKAKLINVRSGRMWEQHFRPLEKLENLQLERCTMQFLFTDGDSYTFMRPDTFEQIEMPIAIAGTSGIFLQRGMLVPIEFFQGEPISIAFPDIVEARIVNTALPSHARQDSAWKEAVLENGLSIRVPLFIAPGEVVRVDVKTGRYVERARVERRRIA
jgi:elongation factor P